MKIFKENTGLYSIDELKTEKDIEVSFDKKIVEIPRVLDPALNYSNSRSHGRGNFIEPEYDLAQIGRIRDTESIVSEAYNKKTALMFKEGYAFVGKNPKTIKYVKTRLAQIAKATNTSTMELLRNLGTNLIQKSNSLLVKVRDEKASGGQVRLDPYYKKTLKPIAGYFSLPAETMKVDRHNNKIQKWQQMLPDGYYKEFMPEDIVHFYFNKKDGFLFGTPTIIPVIDDIRALRKIEENIELLIYQHLFPLFQFKVGTPERPAATTETGEREIDVIKREIQYMPSEGGIVTTERHEITAIGAEGRALRAEKYLDYFQRRVVGGLGISLVDLGNGDCYDIKTQTLTENGWKYHWQIDHTKEKIATYNPETNRIEFHLANYKYENLYYGDMYHIKSKHVDIRVSPHHDMWIKTRTKNAQWQKVKIEDLASGKIAQEFYIKEAAPFEENKKNIDQFYIEPAKCKRGNQPKAISCSLNDFAEFLGWFISEGCLDVGNAKFGSYKIKVYQNEGIDLEKMIANAERLGLSYSILNPWKDREGQSGLMFYSKTLYKWIEENINHLAKNKNLPRQVFNWPKEAREILLNTLISGDGSYDNRACRTNEVYYTTSKKLADDVQILALSLGYQVKVRKTQQSLKSFTKGKGSIYRILISWTKKVESNTRLLNINHIKKEEKQCNTIYCYNVPNHLFVTRRKGKIAIQGNTANRATSDNMSRNLIDSVKDFQQVFESFFDQLIITELLLESTFEDDPLNEENMVHLKFKEIDIATQIKKEAHYADQFNKDTITHDEARISMGKDPIVIPTQEEQENDEDWGSKYPDWQKMRWKMFKEPELLIQSIDEPYSATAKAAAANRALSVTQGQTEEAKKETKEAEAAKQKGKGLTTGIPTRTKLTKKIRNNLEDSILTSHFIDISETVSTYLDFRKTYNEDWINKLTQINSAEIISRLGAQQMSDFQNAYLSVRNKVDNKYVASTRKARISFTSRTSKYVTKLINDINNSLKKHLKNNDNINSSISRSIFDSLQFRISSIESVELNKAKEFGKILGYKDSGVSKLYIISDSNGCNVCKERNVLLLDDTLLIEDIPPFHNKCQCAISTLAAGEILPLGDAKKSKNDSCIQQYILKLKMEHPDWSNSKVNSQAEELCYAFEIVKEFGDMEE